MAASPVRELQAVGQVCALWAKGRRYSELRVFATEEGPVC